MPQSAHALFTRSEQWLQKMIDLQRAKVLRLAREINPKITGDDVLNPQDFPELMRDPSFNFEDGQLTGLVSAQIAMRAEYRRFLEEIGSQG